MRRTLINYWTDMMYQNGGSFVVEGADTKDELDQVLESEVPNHTFADYWDLDRYPNSETNGLRVVRV